MLQMLQLLYYYTRMEHINLKERTKKIIDRVREIWKVDEITITIKDKCIKKLEDLEKKYVGLKNSILLAKYENRGNSTRVGTILYEMVIFLIALRAQRAKNHIKI